MLCTFIFYKWCNHHHCPITIVPLPSQPHPITTPHKTASATELSFQVLRRSRCSDFLHYSMLHHYLASRAPLYSNVCIVAHVMTCQSPPVKISKKFMLVGLHTKQLALCINCETIRVFCVTEFCTFRF